MSTGTWALYILLEVMSLERRNEFDKKVIDVQKEIVQALKNLLNQAQMGNVSYHQEQHLLGIQRTKSRYERNYFLIFALGFLKV